MSGSDHLVIPYTLDANDFKFLLPNGFVTADDFTTYLVDSFDRLRAEGGRMLSVGLHCRIVGRPGRAPALDRFLGHVRAHDDAWVTTRAEIARHWRAVHPPRRSKAAVRIAIVGVGAMGSVTRACSGTPATRSGRWTRLGGARRRHP